VLAGPIDQACRRTPAYQGQALRVAAKTRPALTGRVRGGAAVRAVRSPSTGISVHHPPERAKQTKHFDFRSRQILPYISSWLVPCALRIGPDHPGNPRSFPHMRASHLKRSADMRSYNAPSSGVGAWLCRLVCRRKPKSATGACSIRSATHIFSASDCTLDLDQALSVARQIRMESAILIVTEQLNLTPCRTHVTSIPRALAGRWLVTVPRTSQQYSRSCTEQSRTARLPFAVQPSGPGIMESHGWRLSSVLTTCRLFAGISVRVRSIDDPWNR
jgi:hypothetical protein